MIEAPEITAARRQSERFRVEHEHAARFYALSVAWVAALMVREQMPTAATVVFVKDEETTSADTTISIVKILDSDGVDLGELSDAERQREIEDKLATAYDATGGAGPFNIGVDDDPDHVLWKRNILELDIPAVLAVFTRQVPT